MGLKTFTHQEPACVSLPPRTQRVETTYHQCPRGSPDFLLAPSSLLFLLSPFPPLVNQVDRGWYMCQLNTDPMRSQKGYIEVQGTYVLLDCINATKSNSYNTTSHNLFHLFLKVLTFCIGLQQCTINDHILQSYSTIIRSI